MNKHHILWAAYIAAVGFILFTSTSCKKKPVSELPSHYIPPPLEDTGDVREWDTADEL